MASSFVNDNLSDINTNKDYIKFLLKTFENSFKTDILPIIINEVKILLEDEIKLSK